MENLSIFECLYDNYKISQETPLRLIEFFAGYGSQALALKYLGVKFEHYKICEWAVNSIIAYASLHRNELEEYGNNFCGDLTKEQIASELFSMGVSINYNEPATLDQLKRMSEDKLRLCFNSIMWSNNLVDISRVHGKDLHIEREREHLLTYSFPCQDLSLAGKGAGMEKGSGTRSGLLWEVERILSECENKPQILLMENVTQVHGVGNENHFKKWLLRLEEMGYQNYWEDMTAVDYGIPQTRNRTFMISIQGDYNYKFPKRTPLKLRLKDMLEDNVDEKFYLSEKALNYVLDNDNVALKHGRDINDRIVNPQISKTISCRGAADQRADVTNFVIDNEQKEITVKEAKIRIKNATKKGYLEATEGDGIDISSRMESHRGTVQKDKAQTITTMGGENVGVVVGTYDYAQSDTLRPTEERRLHLGKETSGALLSSGNQNGVVIQLKRGYSCEIRQEQDDANETLKKELCNKLIEDGLVEEGDVVKHSYTNQILNGNKKCVEKNDGCMITLTTRGDCVGVVVSDRNNKPKVIGGIGEKKSNGGTQYYQQDRIYKNNVAISVTTNFNPYYKMDGGSNLMNEEKKCENCKYYQYTNSSYFGGVPYCIKKCKELINTLNNDLENDFCEHYEEKQEIDASNLRIRKLTPKECFRLMGLKDEDIDLVMENQSNASAYHLAGDSIVTTCLMAILGQLFDIDWNNKFKPEEWWKKD